jgi:hypothetical protein
VILVELVEESHLHVVAPQSGRGLDDEVDACHQEPADSCGREEHRQSPDAVASDERRAEMPVVRAEPQLL